MPIPTSSCHILITLTLFLTLKLSTAQQNASLIIRGTKESAQEFTGINKDSKDNLRSIELEYVNFVPDELVEALLGCNNLESLHLRRLNESQWKFTQRVTLPNLKEFTLDIPWLYNGPTETQFKSMIFFDKDLDVDWKLEEIHGLNTDIKLSQYSRNYHGDEFHSNIFEINHKEGKFVSRLGNFIEKVIPNLEGNFDVKKFAMIDWTTGQNVNLTSLDPKWVQQSVQNIEIGPIKIKGGSMSEIVSRPGNLEQLSVRSVKATLEIGDLPAKSLKKLEIGSTEKVEFSKIVQFEKLTTLSYYFSPILDPIMYNYSYIFPSVKYVFFRLKSHEGSLELLRNILRTCAQRIELFDFNWGKSCDNGMEYDDDFGMITFLKNAGVPTCYPDFFRLIKNKTTGEWNATTYSEEYEYSFRVGVDIPDTIQGEGELDDCGVNNYDKSEFEPTTLPAPKPTMSTTTGTSIKPTIWTTTTGKPPTSSTTKNICVQDGFFPDEEDCSKFYRCVENLNTPNTEKSFSKYDFLCPPSTLFDIKASVCAHTQTWDTWESKTELLATCVAIR